MAATIPSPVSVRASWRASATASSERAVASTPIRMVLMGWSLAAGRLRGNRGPPRSRSVDSRGLQLDELVLERVPHELRPRRPAQLLLDVRAVRLDRPRGQEQLLRDLAVGVAPRDQAE